MSCFSWKPKVVEMKTQESEEEYAKSELAEKEK